MPFDNTSDPIDRLKAVLRDAGWVRGQYGTMAGYCVVGAIIMTIEGKKQRVFIQAAQKALGRRGTTTNLIEWNDRFAKNVDDVLALIDEAREFLPTKRW